MLITILFFIFNGKMGPLIIDSKVYVKQSVRGIQFYLRGFDSVCDGRVERNRKCVGEARRWELDWEMNAGPYQTQGLCGHIDSHMA